MVNRTTCSPCHLTIRGWLCQGSEKGRFADAQKVQFYFRGGWTIIAIMEHTPSELPEHSGETEALPAQQGFPPERFESLHDKHVSQAWADQQASSDEFDKSLLTFSSSALGLSLAFIKDVVPLDKAGWLPYLLLSWVSFAGCIIVTIASFQFSIQAQKAHIKYLHKYYLENRPEFYNKKSAWSIAVTVCAIVGSILFLAGLVATIVFAWENISKGVHK